MKMAIRLSGFMPVPVPYESGGVALPDKASADGMCKGINDLGSGPPRWRVEEVKLNGKNHWMIVSDT